MEARQCLPTAVLSHWTMFGYHLENELDSPWLIISFVVVRICQGTNDHEPHSGRPVPAGLCGSQVVLY